LVEHATENRSVGGSIPPLGTIFFSSLLFNWLLALGVRGAKASAPPRIRRAGSSL
jgi:hypothetical protein